MMCQLQIVHLWKDAPSWRQRSACVSMLHFARRDMYTETILDICVRDDRASRVVR